LPSFYTLQHKQQQESNEIYFFAGGVTSSLGRNQASLVLLQAEAIEQQFKI
jgi:hypothetical protein